MGHEEFLRTLKTQSIVGSYQIPSLLSANYALIFYTEMNTKEEISWKGGLDTTLC